MGRPLEGWRLRKQKGSTVLAVSFTWQGREVTRTTGERETKRAEAAAARIYARWVSGEQQPRARQHTVREPGDSLERLATEWLTGKDGQPAPCTQRVRTRIEYMRYFEATLCEAFPTLTSVCSESVSEYSSARLRCVLPQTVRKELSALRGLGRWAEPKENWDARVPGIPKTTKGKPWHQRRRGKATPLSATEAQAFLAKLPEWSRRRHGHRWAIRARFIVAYETGLRPATLSKLSAPEHWDPTATHLIITDEIDKAKFGRELELTPVALAALSGVVTSATWTAAGGLGLIFGSHDYRNAVTAAAREAGIPLHRVKTLCPYDIRHARASHVGAHPAATMTGMMAMFGWKQPSTAARYIHPPKRAASDMLREMGELSSASTEAATTTTTDPDGGNDDPQGFG